MDQVFLVNGVRYKLRTPKNENELQEMVEEHYKDIFGENSIFFGFEHKLRSVAGIGSKPDGCVLLLSPKPRWVVVETELSAHPLYEHVIPQISKFVKALENPQNRRGIVEVLYDEINKDPFKKALLEKNGFGHEIYKFLNDVISTKPSMAMVIDERTAEIDEVLGVLPLKAEISELRTFVREDAGLEVHAHLLGMETVEEGPEEGGKEISPHMRSWSARLEWVAPETRELVQKLIKRVESEFSGILHVPRFRWYYFYKGKGRSLEALFSVLMIGKKVVSVRIKANPASFKDPKKWTKKYKGWFFARAKHEEREFSISNPEQLDYALGLIEQSYDISRG